MTDLTRTNNQSVGTVVFILLFAGGIYTACDTDWWKVTIGVPNMSIVNWIGNCVLHWSTDVNRNRKIVYLCVIMGVWDFYKSGGKCNLWVRDNVNNNIATSGKHSKFVNLVSCHDPYILDVCHLGKKKTTNLVAVVFILLWYCIGGL